MTALAFHNKGPNKLHFIVSHFELKPGKGNKKYLNIEYPSKSALSQGLIGTPLICSQNLIGIPLICSRFNRNTLDLFARSNRNSSDLFAETDKNTSDMFAGRIPGYG